ncbi:tRNA uridine-5-carboxymethylaminomethyl(34) synthesis GTPase MnmE [Bacteroides heparinolyticus]|uniref:tRNA uridine-5-carboxymethylaminomethyl(34) synthesis GTPase MnmE n=1 Tax=Prevotella heparinolytica TaxID=28113 RepID=UPI00359FD492
MFDPTLFQQDTICATATAPGVGGIAVIRVSGSQAFAVVAAVFVPFGQHTLGELPVRQAIYGRLQCDGELIDEVVVVKYRAPHSYTGEDTVEISCHGSLYIQQRVLQACLSAGCRMAAPGEFTRRAYLNGKMDLSQAEAVADLIASESAAQHRLALSQLRGGYSAEFNTLRDRLIQFVSLIELELDFSEEDVEFADRSSLLQLADDISARLKVLMDSFRLGNALKKGIPVAIVGATNVGKSTLLNRLLGEDKAIVSSIHGTTRDVIEDTINIDGVLFRFIDTAGIRMTEDEIENMGIERSYRKLEEATVVLWLADLSGEASPAIDPALVERMRTPIQDKRVILIANKSDEVSEKRIKAFRISLPPELSALPFHAISARFGHGIEELKQAVSTAAHLSDRHEGDIVVSNARHYQLMQDAAEVLDRVRSGLRDGLSGDLLSLDLRYAITLIGEITGSEITSDTILHNIFAHFCIGK